MKSRGAGAAKADTAMALGMGKEGLDALVLKLHEIRHNRTRDAAGSPGDERGVVAGVDGGITGRGEGAYEASIQWGSHCQSELPPSAKMQVFVKICCDKVSTRGRPSVCEVIRNPSYSYCFCLFLSLVARALTWE